MGGLRVRVSAARERPGRSAIAICVMAAVAVVASTFVFATPAEAYNGAPWFRPGFTYNQNFPDPTIVRDGSTYYAYAGSTGGAFLPVMTSTDLTTWTARPAYPFPGGCQNPNDDYFNDALPCRPSWAHDFSNGRLDAEVIAPGVIKNGSTWLAYLTVRVQVSPIERHCIGLATAGSPLGPFTVQGSSWLQCDSDPGGSRDAEPFRDVNGDLYLVWKSEGVAVGQGTPTPTRIWTRRLSDNGLSFAGGSAATELLRTSLPWEGTVIENPSMVAWNGGWWLFYSGNEWQSGDYATGYARCASALGPCSKPQADPLLKNTGVILGPGGASAFVDTGGRLRLDFHYWTYPYTNYPTNPGCDGFDPLTGAQLCASQGQRRMGVTGVVNPGGNILTVDPVGSFDSAVNDDGVVDGSGWALDGETTGPVTVHVYADGQKKTEITANQSRPDIGAAFPGMGNNHGFTFSLSGLAEGNRQICLYAMNLGMGTVNKQFGCRTVNVQPVPPDLPLGPPPALVNDTGFHPLTPARLLDTRDGTGFDGGPARDNWTIPLTVAGRGGVPPSGAASVLLNVTVNQTTGAGGFVTVYACGGTRPVASNLNFNGGDTVPNLVSVPVGAEGKVCLYTNRQTHLIADVVGWFGTSPPGAALNPQAPQRVLDTRDGTGLSGKFTQGQTRTLDVTDVGGVPANGVSAVVLNTTITQATTGGYLTVFPGNVSRPLASNLNWGPGDTRPNLVTVPVAPDGTIKLYNDAGQVHVIGDVVGWYGPAGSAGDLFTGLPPNRVLDTRFGNGLSGKIGAGQVRSLAIAGTGGVPASGATAVVLNVTVVETSTTSFLTLFPAGVTRPTASNLNWSVGQIRPNLVVVPLGANGSVSMYNDLGQTHVIFDVVGWYG